MIPYETMKFCKFSFSQVAVPAFPVHIIFVVFYKDFIVITDILCTDNQIFLP